MSEDMETMNHNLSGAQKSIIGLMYKYDEARFMEPFGTAGSTCTSLHFGVDGVDDCDYPYAEKCMITSVCGGIAGIDRNDFANLKETGRFNAGRGFSKWGEGWRGFIMNTIRRADLVRRREREEDSANTDDAAKEGESKVLLLSNHKDYGLKQLAFYYVSSSDTPFHFSKGGEREMTAENKKLYTQHMHKYHNESNPFGHVCIYPQAEIAKEKYQSIEQFLLSVFNERIIYEELRLNIGGKLIESTYPLCGPWVQENGPPDNFFNNYISSVKYGKCTYKGPKDRAKTYPKIMQYDKYLPKSVIEKHPLAKHGYLLPALSKKKNRLIFANPDYIKNYEWDDNMTHKQSISNATQKITETQVKKFFHSEGGGSLNVLNGYHIFMENLKINPGAIRRVRKGALRGREGQDYRPRLGIYLPKFDRDNKLTHSQRAKFDDIKPRHCLDCIMCCMGLMYKIELAAAKEEGKQSSTDSNKNTSSPSVSPSTSPNVSPSVSPSISPPPAPDMLGADNVKLPGEIAAEGFQVDMEGNCKNFPSDRDSDSQTTDESIEEDTETTEQAKLKAEVKKHIKKKQINPKQCKTNLVPGWIYLYTLHNSLDWKGANGENIYGYGYTDTTDVESYLRMRYSGNHPTKKVKPIILWEIEHGARELETAITASFKKAHIHHEAVGTNQSEYVCAEESLILKIMREHMSKKCVEHIPSTLQEKNSPYLVL